MLIRCEESGEWTAFAYYCGRALLGYGSTRIEAHRNCIELMAQVLIRGYGGHA